jgi:hypothetical protein
MNFHDLKDIVMIYSDHTYDRPDNPSINWDKADIVLWDPVQQKRYDLVFTGSRRGETDTDPKTINFNIQERAESQEEIRRLDVLNRLILATRELDIKKKEVETLKNEYDGIHKEN